MFRHINTQFFGQTRHTYKKKFITLIKKSCVSTNPCLSQRRVDMRLILVYKIHKNIIAVDFHHKLIPVTWPSRHQHHLSYQTPLEKKLYIQQSFLPRTIVQWNALPVSAVTMPTLEGFKSAVHVLTH